MLEGRLPEIQPCVENGLAPVLGEIDLSVTRSGWYFAVWGNRMSAKEFGTGKTARETVYYAGSDFGEA